MSLGALEFKNIMQYEPSALFFNWMSRRVNLCIHVLLSVIYIEYMVYVWVVFSIITTKNEGNNMGENMDYDYKINDYQKCIWEVSSQLPFLSCPRKIELLSWRPILERWSKNWRHDNGFVRELTSWLEVWT